MAEPIKRIDIKEFRERGYLQEVNRCFLHPLGLALEIVVDDDGGERLGGVWDYRDDPEGMMFGDDMPLDENALLVAAEWIKKLEVRMKKFGWMVQPAGVGVSGVENTAG